MSLLEVQDLGFRRSTTWILRHLDFSLKAGEAIGLSWPSGEGKTTLLRLVLGLLEPEEGSIRLAGEPWSPLAERLRRPHRPLLQACPQEAKASLPLHLEGRRILQEALRAFRVSPSEWSLRLGEACVRADFPEALLDLPAAQLSGGQGQRLALARALVARPSLLLLDEPFSAQDPLQVRSLVETLARLKAEGTGLLVASHDKGPLRALVNREL